jgi:UDP-sugar transporter A1/2/3
VTIGFIIEGVASSSGGNRESSLPVMELLSVKNMALAALVLQNSLLVLFMRYSLTVERPLYASSTAVASAEVIKMICCLLMVFIEGGAVRVLKEEIVNKPFELLKVAVPSLIYTIQNNVLYFALSHLDAATFQVGYQLKILTTAVFSVLMLGKKLSSCQWLALVVLTLGVSLAQLASGRNAHTSANTSSGFIAVLVASLLSGFAGVYFESILKGSTASVWVRNIQMCLTSIPISFFSAYYFSDRKSVVQNGFFYGFNELVIFVILLQAVGGLVVAVVVKYADNILKGFAAGFSILTSCILSYFFFDFKFTLFFVLGAALVNVSMYMYSFGPPSSVVSSFTAKYTKTSSKGDLEKV